MSYGLALREAVSGSAMGWLGREPIGVATYRRARDPHALSTMPTTALHARPHQDRPENEERARRVMERMRASDAIKRSVPRPRPSICGKER